MVKELYRHFKTGKEILISPHVLFERLSVEGNATSVFKYYIALNLVLAILTPIVNILGFPSDVIHASTNAQMAAYKYSPVLEQYLVISRHFWTGILTLTFAVLNLPEFVLFYHLSAKLLGGKGGWLASLKTVVYPATPSILFGWVPYSDFIFGLWTGFFLVPGFHYFHKISWGKSTGFAAFLVGLQILYVILSGGRWLIEP